MTRDRRKEEEVDAVRAPHVLILAAGMSSRMRGADKLLMEIDGVPQLRRLAQAALAAHAPVSVVLGPAHDARRQALDRLPVTVVTAAMAARGMAESLKAGLAALPPEAAVLLLLADLPDIGTHEIATLIRRHRADPTAILRGATEAGRAGHPVLLPAWLRPDLRALQGDIGARALLARHPARIRLVPLSGIAATTDLDTPAAWAAWQAGRHGRSQAP